MLRDYLGIAGFNPRTYCLAELAEISADFKAVSYLIDVAGIEIYAGILRRLQFFNGLRMADGDNLVHRMDFAAFVDFNGVEDDDRGLIARDDIVIQLFAFFRSERLRIGKLVPAHLFGGNAQNTADYHGTQNRAFSGFINSADHALVFAVHELYL